MFQQFSVRQRHDQRGFGGDVIAKRIIVRQLSIAPPRSPVLIRRNNTLPLGPLLRRQGIVTENCYDAQPPLLTSQFHDKNGIYVRQ